jgi:hypothetical protein
MADQAPQEETQQLSDFNINNQCLLMISLVCNIVDDKYFKIKYKFYLRKLSIFVNIISTYEEKYAQQKEKIHELLKTVDKIFGNAYHWGASSRDTIDAVNQLSISLQNLTFDHTMYNMLDKFNKHFD